MMKKKQFMLSTIFCAVHTVMWSASVYAQEQENIPEDDQQLE